MNNRSLAIAVFSFLLVGCFFVGRADAQNQRTRNQARAFEDQAKAAFGRKDYRDAADKYNQSLLLIPNNPNTHYWKGVSLYWLWSAGRERVATLEKSLSSGNRADIERQISQQKEQDELAATEALKELAIAMTQGFKPIIEIYRLRRYIHFERKDYDSALADINRALGIAPKDPEFLKDLAEVHLARNENPPALDALRRAAQAAPNDADVQYNLARVYFANGDPKLQQTSAEAALARGTRFPGEAHFLVADAYQKQGNLDEAIKSYNRAISSKPEMYRAYRNVADIYRNEGRFEDAISTLKRAQAAFPLDGELYTDLSWYYSLADRPADAVKAAQAGITLLPNNYVPFTNLCRAHNELREYSLAANACNSALRIQPNDGETLYYLGNALAGQGRSVDATRPYYTRAVTGLLEYTAKNPNYSDGWYLLGNAYFVSGQHDKAIEAYLKCLSISPKFLKARVNLGIAYTRRKNKPAAMEQYNILLQTNKALADRLKIEIDDM